MEAAKGTSVLGIGTRLRAARERAGLTVIQAGEKLHLDPTVIEALENEDFGLLGAPVYVRGHMRRYAELIGEQGRELQEIYSGSLQSAAVPDLTHAPRAETTIDWHKLARPLAIVAGGAALVAAVWMVVSGLPGPTPGAGQSAQETAAMVVEAPGVQPPPAVVAGVPESSEPTGARMGPATVAAGPATPAPRPPAAEPAERAVRTPPPPEPAREVELRLTLNADSWVEIYDARGERLFYDVASANSVQTVSGRAPLQVTLGNAPGVAVAINGREVSIPPSAGANEAARFVISSSGRVAQTR